MRTLKVALGLVVSAWLLTFAVTPALALTPVWQDCVETLEGKFEDKGCTKEKAKSKFEWLEINAGTQKVKSEGTLKLTDLNGAVKEKVTIECKLAEKGTVGSSESTSVGEITEVVASSCKATAGKACEKVTAEAVNLPWKTELEEKEKEKATEFRNNIKSKEKAPGWKMVCNGKENDTCEAATSVAIENKEVENPETKEKEDAVIAKFDKNSAKETCTHGGKEAGETGGEEKIKANEEGAGGVRAFKGPLFHIEASNNGKVLVLNEEATYTIENISPAASTPAALDHLLTPEAFEVRTQVMFETCKNKNYTAFGTGATSKCAFNVKYIKEVGIGFSSSLLILHDTGGQYADRLVLAK